LPHPNRLKANSKQRDVTLSNCVKIRFNLVAALALTVTARAVTMTIMTPSFRSRRMRRKLYVHRFHSGRRDHRGDDDRICAGRFEFVAELDGNTRVGGNGGNGFKAGSG